MAYSPEQLEEFAVRAATLDERLSSQYEPLPGLKSDADIAARRLATWCRHAASGDWALFAKRLRRDGLTMEQAMPRLSAIRRHDGAPLPAWVTDGAWIVPALLGTAPLETIAAIRRAEAHPFEGLFYGLVAAAQDRRDALLPASARARISASLHAELSRSLLATTTKLCAMAIYENFAVIRDAWSKEDGAPTEPPSRTRYYERFVTEMRRSGLQRLFETKPVLLRLLASLTRQWIETTAEFLRRLDADFAAIRRDLIGGAGDIPLASIEMGLSDLHNFGRSVYIVRFADGSAAVYKPKDVTVDARWVALVDWLNQRGPPTDLQAARVLARDGYGWCEFIAHGDIPDRAAAERFFRRAGALLALWHLMVGSDMHEENMIAAGEQPVPIDLEMLLQAHDPSAATDAPPLRAQEAAGKRLAQSVLTTGLLPSWLRTPETAMIALGGLHDGLGGPMPEQTWAQINTDAMVPARAPWQPGQHANLPKLNGAAIKLPDHLDSLIEGCGDYLRFIMEQKKELLAENGPVAAFAGVPIRRVLKPTRFYALLLDRLRNHRDMRDGAEWSAHLDFVSRLADWDKGDEALWPLFAAERRSLGDLNIPFFVHAADGDRVRDGGGSSSAASGLQPALGEARRRIETLDAEEIAWQLKVIRLTVVDDPLNNPAFFAEKARERSSAAAATAVLEPSTALKAADEIADELRQSASRDSGGAAWIGLDPLADGGGWQLVALGSDLYGGAPGVSLFLAAHARISGAATSRELAFEGLAPSRYLLHSSGAARFARVAGIGGASGISSLIYALITTARFLEDQSLVDDALTGARLLSDDVIGADKVYDIIGGAAGAILCLLKLHRETGDLVALDRAIACGTHLLRSRPQTANGPGIWKHLGPRPLAGFSHGAAGFAYALAALAKATGNSAFAAAAQDCLAYERAIFSPERGNWPDLREVGENKSASFPCQWCHGAGGIGLARLGMQRFGACDVDISADIDTAVATVRRGSPSPIDTWCCGNLGNIETLAEAARSLGRSELDEEASRRTAEVLETARRTGSFGWNAAGNAENLGLFRGLAGVGYSLLRRAAPGQLPNVLIWE